MCYEVKRTAEIVKKMRKQKGVTQEQVSESIGISIKTYQAVEQGSRGIRIDTLWLLADYYEVSIDELTGRTNNDEAMKSEKVKDKEVEVSCGTDSTNSAANVIDEKWNELLSSLSAEQKAQLFSIAANVKDTMQW